MDKTLILPINSAGWSRCWYFCLSVGAVTGTTTRPSRSRPLQFTSRSRPTNYTQIIIWRFSNPCRVVELSDIDRLDRVIRIRIISRVIVLNPKSVVVIISLHITQWYDVNRQIWDFWLYSILHHFYYYYTTDSHSEQCQWHQSGSGFCAPKVPQRDIMI